MSAQPRPWALVTGGAQRLGREIGLAFAMAGWNVFCHYQHSHEQALQTQAEIRALGVDCHLLRMDLAEPDAASSLLAQCEALAQTPPHCIVNNASIFVNDDAASATQEMLLRHFQVNTATPLLLANALRQRVENLEPPTRGQFSVVHLLDQKVHNLNPDYFSYTVSKLALERSVALQAQALAPWVRVCGVSPGLVYLSGPQSQSNFDVASRVNLLQQTIRPADVAACVVFIASNPSLNGATLPADNGQHLVALNRDVIWAVESPAAP